MANKINDLKFSIEILQKKKKKKQKKKMHTPRSLNGFNKYNTNKISAEKTGNCYLCEDKFEFPYPRHNP